MVKDMFKSRFKYLALALALTTTMVSCEKDEYTNEDRYRNTF